MKRILLFAFVLLSMSSFVLINSISWTIDEDYEVKFSTSKAEGTFSGLDGQIIFDPSDLAASSFNVKLDVSTISTGNKTKDKHAVGKKWFSASVFPDISFQSSEIRQAGEAFEVTGMLKIRDIQKEMTFPFSVEAEGERRIFKGSFTVDRHDFEIEGPMLFGGMVGDEVKVDLRVPVKQ